MIDQSLSESPTYWQKLTFEIYEIRLNIGSEYRENGVAVC